MVFRVFGRTSREALIGSHAGVAYHDSLQFEIIVVESVGVVVLLDDLLGEVGDVDCTVAVASEIKIVLFVGWESVEELPQAVNGIFGKGLIGIAALVVAFGKTGADR